jgi:hypothetical protein
VTNSVAVSAVSAASAVPAVLAVSAVSSGTTGRSGRDRLPRRLVLVLVAARDAESAANGAQRRVAWRTTRELLGGALAAGYAARLLANCLGVGLDSIRTRADRDAWVAGEAIVGLGDIQIGDVKYWRTAGVLSAEQLLPDGCLAYPAADIVRAVACFAPVSDHGDH